MNIGQKPPAAVQGTDGRWIVILAAIFTLSLLASWQRWSDPIVDVGREMNQPLRLVNGDALYSDVRHIYGPLSPTFHALLYRVFGPSLTLLYLDGIVTAALVLGLVYWLARQIMRAPAAAGATLNVMALCIFKPAGNYILPYSYNSIHGTALGLITLTILTVALRRSLNGRGGTVHLFLIAGITTGLATLAKVEMGAAALLAGLTAAVIAGWPDSRRTARLTVVFASTMAGLTAGVYAFVLSRVGWAAVAVDGWLLTVQHAS